jgi:hypothetical protein
MISRKRLYDCALANTPASVIVIRFFKAKFKKAIAYCRPNLPNYGKLVAPRPDTPYRLHIYLHECAHFALHSRAHKHEHEMEYEAEDWAFSKMRQAGIPIPRETMRRSRRNVGVCIVRELWHNNLAVCGVAEPRISAQAARWALGRHWKKKLGLIIDARQRKDAACMKSFLGF